MSTWRPTMLLLLSLLACTDPAPVAVQACESMPTVAATPEGLALFEAMLTPGEHALLSQQQPTLGLEVVGEAGLAALRSGASCTATEVKHAGPGMWKVILDRRAPSLAVDGPGEEVLHHFEWMVVRLDEGLRVETDLQRYTSMRSSLQDGLLTDDHDRAVSLWQNMIDGYGDPTLVHDLASAEKARTHYMYGRKLGTQVLGRDGGELVGTLFNRGSHDVPEVSLLVVFTDPDGNTVETPVKVGPVSREGELEVRVTAPDWERLRKARIDVVDWTLVSPEG